jgi:hypothetical protein
VEEVKSIVMICMKNKINKYTLLFSILLLGALVHPKISSGQTKIKPSLYLFFEENPAKGMFKENRKIEALIRPEKKINRSAYEYDIYTYRFSRDTPREYRYKLVTINKENYCIRDSTFIKNVKQFNDVKNIKGFSYDTSDYKRFPYKKVFIVEKFATNQYKVIEVSTYIGSDY